VFVSVSILPKIEPKKTDNKTAGFRQIKHKKRGYHREYKRRRAANGGKSITPVDARTPEQFFGIKVRVYSSTSAKNSSRAAFTGPDWQQMDL